MNATISFTHFFIAFFLVNVIPLVVIYMYKKKIINSIFEILEFRKNKILFNENIEEKKEFLGISILIENPNDKAVNNIKLFNSFDTDFRTLNKDGSFTFQENFVKISSRIENINYRQILSYISVNKINPELIYLRSETNDNIFYPIKLQNLNIKGECKEIEILMSIDPYQHQSNVVVKDIKDYNIKMDGFSSLIISKIEAKSSVIIDIYFSKQM